MAASAIENARLYEAERRNRRLAQTLSSFSMAITQSLDVNVVLRVLLDYLGQLVPYDRAAAMLVEWGTRFAVRAVRGDNGAVDPRSGISGHLRRERHPRPRANCWRSKGRRVVEDIRRIRRGRDIPGAEGARSWMGVPLVASGRVFGMYSLAKRRRRGFIGRSTWNSRAALASQASAAIQSAWLFEKVGEGRARLQSLSRQLVRIQESERRAVSRELHDEAGQSLASLKVDLHLLEAKAGRPGRGQSAAISDLQRQVDEVMVGLHRLASNLRPASLDHVGLSAAVQQMVETLNQQGGPQVEFEGGRLGAQRLPEFTETALCTASCKRPSPTPCSHSRATRVSVLLERREGKVVAVIEDDGIGLRSHPGAPRRAPRSPGHEGAGRDARRVARRGKLGGKGDHGRRGGAGCRSGFCSLTTTGCSGPG